MYYKDPDTGIQASVNIDACETQEQLDACQDFLLTLAGVPTEKEKEEWIPGYDKFKIVLNTMMDLDQDIHKYCKWVKKCGGPPRTSSELKMNIDSISVEKYKDVRNLLDVIEVVFK